MLEIAPEPAKPRLNIRAIVILTVVAVLAIAATLTVHGFRGSRLRAAALAEVRRLIDEGHLDRAIGNLDAFLAMNHDDLEASDLEAKLLAETARSLDQLLAAATFNDRFARIHPDAPGAQDARRRTADLYIRFGDLYLESSYYRNVPEMTAFNMRHRAATAVAQSLIDRGATDAGAYFLLARAKEGLALSGDPGMLDESIGAYRQALKVDPDDLLAADRLATLLVDRKHDKAGALGLLDGLEKRRPDSARLRLVRYRFFARLGDDARASTEMAALIRLAPDDPITCLEAAEMHLRRGRTGEARRLVDKLPPSLSTNLRVRLVCGLIELNEDRPAEAMEIWRKGLVSSRGSDAMLTWNLAFSMIQLDRLKEAGPLVAQYRRLIGDDSSPMLNLLLGAREQKEGQSFRAANRLEGLRERIDPRWKAMVDSTLGRSYGDVGDLAKSTSAYRRVLLDNPGAVAIRAELAGALTPTRPQEAAEIVEAGLIAAPDDPSLWVALASARLRKLEEQTPQLRLWGPFDRAMARAIELAPSHPSLTTIRSRRQALEGKTEDAAALLERALASDPRNPQLWEAYVDALLKAGRPVEALTVLDRASSPGAVGDTVGVRLARFGVLRLLGRAGEARDQLARGLDQFPMDQRARAWDALARDHASRGESSRALEILSGWAAQIPEDIRPRLALLEMSLHDPGPIGRAASVALRRSGTADDLAGLLDRARALIRAEPGANPGPPSTGDAPLREAEQLLELARAIDSQSSIIDELRGEISERRGLPGEAIQAYRRAWSRGSEGILPRLINLLGRNSPGELERFGGDGPAAVARQVTRAFLGLGQPDRAARVAATDPEPDATPEARAWRLELLGRLNRPDLAEALLRAEATHRPSVVESWTALLRSQVGQGKTEAIAGILEEAKGAIKDDRAEFVEARLARATGDREAADRAFRLALESRPDDIEILLAAAEFEQEAGRAAGAEGHLRRVLTLDPNHRKAARTLALLLSSRATDELGWDRAWAALGPEPSAPEGPEDRLARAIVLSRSPGPDRRRQAVGLLETLVVDLPGDSRASTTARDLLAKLLLDDNQVDRAAALLDPVGGRTEEDPQGLALAAEALIRSGRLDRAGEQIDRLAKLDPLDDRTPRLKVRLIAAKAEAGQAPRDLERALIKLGDTPAALPFGREAFALVATAKPPADEIGGRMALLLASKNPGLSWMPALIASRRGKAAEAFRLCRTAVEACTPADAREAARVANGAAIADPKVDHRADLDEILEAASQRDPEGTEIPLQLAQLRHSQGRFEDAVKIYRAVIERRPDLRASIQNNLAWILSEDLHRPEEAIGVVDDLLKSGGRTAATLDTRGVILTRLGRPAEAVKDLEESIRIGPEPVHLFHLARAYKAANRLDDFARCRDLVRRTGLAPGQVDPSERADLTTILQP